MTFPMHSFRDIRHSTLSLILLVAFAGIAGCGSDNSTGGLSSPPDWVVVPSGGQHAKSATRDYIANGGSIPCSECHGADLSGGNSQVSCFGNPAGCHHGPVSGWVATSPAAQNHGVSAKQAPGSSSFVSCQICHGRDFSGGGSQVSCFLCHGANAPHPARPWHGPMYTHITTDTENAQVCAQCHFPGSPNNPANQPATPAAAGTPPGCFNSTLCHGAKDAPHAFGTVWRDPNPQFHGLTAKQDLSYCQGCHGMPGTTLFNGGTAPTSCETSDCHALARAHPVPWYQASQPFPAYVGSHRDSGNHSVACAICHKVDGPGMGPDPNAPSCFSVSFAGVTCHSGSPGGVNHSVPYPGATHTSADQTSFDADCSVCHAITGVSPSFVAPLCTVCHQSGSPLTSLDCTSCHGDPPSGATYPNVAGKHAVHDALPGMGVCNPCHNGLDTGTLEHYDRANARPGDDALRVPPGDIAFLTEYSAKSGTAAFTAANRTCSNVICHGGQATPDWQTSTANAIDVPNACLNCHVSGTTQYNSYNSGMHDRHITEFGLSATTCKLCHDVAKVTVSGHFQNLSTPAFEQPAAETILPAVTYNGLSCDPNKGGLTGCHKKKNW
jgi:predicted CxxxxCH...CXXCH cytochrome family protein